MRSDSLPVSQNMYYTEYLMIRKRAVRHVNALRRSSEPNSSETLELKSKLIIISKSHVARFGLNRLTRMIHKFHRYYEVTRRRFAIIVTRLSIYTCMAREFRIPTHTRRVCETRLIIISSKNRFIEPTKCSSGSRWSAFHNARMVVAFNWLNLHMLHSATPHFFFFFCCVE